MKQKNLLYSGLILILAQVFFSCSSAEYYRLAPSNQEAYSPAKTKTAPLVKDIKADEPALIGLVEKESLAPTNPEIVLEASTASPLVAKQYIKETLHAPVPVKNLQGAKQPLSPQEEHTLTLAKERLTNLTKAEKKEFKTSINDVLRENASDSNILEIIFAILIPPVGVFLHEGLTSRFWISLLLTILFFIPGMIYALLVVTDTI